MLEARTDIELIKWDLVTPPPRDHIDMVITPFVTSPQDNSQINSISTQLVQAPSIGFEHLTSVLDGRPLANAASVHETATAELTLTHLLVMQRGIQRSVRSQDKAEWDTFFTPGLADSRVLMIGYGGVGKAIVERLLPFEVTIDRIAFHERDDELGHVYTTDALDELLPLADIVVMIVPNNEQTHKMVDDAFLAKMKDGAILHNMGRGGAVDTEAMVRAGDRLRFSFDVVDPEPFPADSPLWLRENVFITGHQGGYTGALDPRMKRLFDRQIDHLLAGETPENLISY